MRRNPSLVALFALSAFGALSCVTKGTHEEMLKKHAEERLAQDSALTRMRHENTTLRAEFDKLREEQRNTAAERDALKTRVAELGQQLGLSASERIKLQESLDAQKSTLLALSQKKSEAEKQAEEFRKLNEKFKRLVDAGTLKIKMVDGRMVVELASDVLFASGSAALNKVGQTAIADVAQTLATIDGKRFQIEGHTDNVPIRSANYPSNWELAAGRALTVLKAMVGAGLPEKVVSAASFGEHRPARANDTDANKAANRRIEIVVVPDLSMLAAP